MIYLGVSLLVGGFVMLLMEIGYRSGVRETERRWSEAVRRADHAKK